MTEPQAKHEMSDGRAMPPSEMSTKHLWAARGSLLKWLKAETDPDQRRDLKANLKLIMYEIGQRTGRQPAE